jgi:hypothetical protein
LAEPSNRLGVVQPGGFGNPPGGVLALWQLAQHPQHAILLLRGLSLGSGRGRLSGALRGSVDLLASDASGRRFSVTGSTGCAHDDWFAAFRPDDRKLAPVAPGSAHRTAASGTVDRGQVLGTQLLHPHHDSRPAARMSLWAVDKSEPGHRTSPDASSDDRGRGCFGVSGVFLSYRRLDGAWADRLARSLANRFGADLVFQDVEDIAGGERWRASIRAAIEGAEVVVVAIGPGWLVDQAGRRRLDEPDDVLRAELVEALTADKPIVPVLVGDAAMPARQDLPDPLADLTEHQAVHLDDQTWNIDVESLLDRVRALTLPTRHSEPIADVREELMRLQGDFFARLDGRDVAGALDKAQRTLATLNRISPLYPDDVFLQIVRGYTHKNCAIALLTFGRDAEAAERLDASDQVFTTLLEEYPAEPSAWDGKGSVLAMRGQLKDSLPYFERAIELNPNYPEARQNRDAVVRALKEARP